MSLAFHLLKSLNLPKTCGKIYPWTLFRSPFLPRKHTLFSGGGPTLKSMPLRHVTTNFTAYKTADLFTSIYYHRHVSLGV